MSDEPDVTPEIEDDAAEEGGAETPTRYGAIESESAGQAVLHATVEGYLATATAAFDDGFHQLVDLTAVDYLTYGGTRALPDGIEAERFELVTSLLNLQRRERIRIHVQLPADAPEVASVFDLWPGCEILEREVFDMFGITFTDHPDMSRVLMPEDWVGHPLRKDYAVGSIPVQFKAASNNR